MKNITIRHWMIFISACSLMVAASVNTCFSFFVEPITSQLGYTRSAFTLTISLMSFVGIFSMPLLGNLFTRFGARKLIAICGVVCSLGLVSFSFSTSLISFYVSGILFGLLLPATTVLGAVILINT